MEIRIRPAHDKRYSYTFQVASAESEDQAFAKAAGILRTIPDASWSEKEKALAKGGFILISKEKML